MGKLMDGYVVILEQGGPQRQKMYARARFPGAKRTLGPEHIRECTDIHDATVFCFNNRTHVQALRVIEQNFPEAVPIRVNVTRTITVVEE